MNDNEAALTIYTDRPPEFWQDMGPFFASRAVKRELPYLADGEGYVWFVLRQAGRVVGFASLHVAKDGSGQLHSLYVDPEHRGNGLASRLVAERLAWLRARGVTRARAIAGPQAVPVLLRAGFTDAGKDRGSYKTMEVEL